MILGGLFGGEILVRALKMPPHAAEYDRVAQHAIAGQTVTDAYGAGGTARHPACNFSVVEVEDGLDE